MLLFAALFAVAWAGTCPENYFHEPETDRCIRVFKQSKTFFNAQLQCTREGGNLATLTNTELLHGHFGQASKVFTGLNRLLSPDWKSLDHSPIPSSIVLNLKRDDSELCSVYDIEFGIYGTVSCETALPFACSHAASGKVALPEKSDSCPICQDCTCYPRCPVGWTYFDITSSCYKTFFNANFNAAEGNCSVNSAHLVSIHSQAENDFVVTLSTTGISQSSTYRHVWIGLYLNLGKWIYTDGTPVDFTSWKAYTLTNGYNCGLMYVDDYSSSAYYYGRWDSYNCDYSMRAYVCKKQAAYV